MRASSTRRGRSHRDTARLLIKLDQVIDWGLTRGATWHVDRWRVEHPTDTFVVRLEPEVRPRVHAAATGKPLRTEEGTVTSVADGDTVTVITLNQSKLRVRMFGSDAPETPKGTNSPGQSYGKEAEASLKQLVEGKRVTVEIDGADRDRRLLATIFLDGNDINLAMIEAGLAEVYRGPESGNPYTQQYQAADAKARAAQKGMWMLGDQYESPRDDRYRVGIRR
jgi:micrococcal nuclease